MADAYRLAALLKLRQRAREEAEQQLAVAQSAQKKAEQHVEAAQKFEAACRARVEEAKAQLYAGEGLTIGKIQTREQYIKRLVAELEEALKAVAQAERALEAYQRPVL